MKLRIISIFFAFVTLALVPTQEAETTESTRYWMKVRAQDQFERSVIANTGVSIEAFTEGYVIAIGNREEKNQLEKLGWIETSYALNYTSKDFPAKDAEYHNYAELKQALTDLNVKYPVITKLFSIGQSIEGREILGIRISGDLEHAKEKPAVIFMGGHHAREHLSVEMPLRFVQYLLEKYAAGDQRIVGLVNNRDIHVIPAVNVDGLEFDIASGSYQMWRKNRRINSNGTYGVDLNRNYGFQWGTGGSSSSPNSDTFKGPTPFSEPESQAIKKYIEDNVNISTLLSFHTFSKLILYPWGHKFEGISEKRDFQVHKIMAETMAQWNGYTPEQASELYIASGDTTDWAYGEHKIISFTFELDPSNSGFGGGGFYPGAAIIKEVVQKNIEPCLYLLEYADNPYRVLPVR